MNLLEELLNRRWILKSENRELYYQVKDGLKEIRKVMKDKFGYAIIVNPYLIKLEKIPGVAEPWMGIQEFTSIKEYQMFCYLLMYLEDKERDYQFVLSTLTEYIQAQFPKGEIDWLNFTTRRQLIRVVKYALSQNLIIHHDGDEDRFSKDVNSEVLYENTGISRYFMKNFTREIMEYQSPADFEKSEWIGMDEDRGFVRRQRIYRRLLLSPSVYRKENDDDFTYIRNYRHQIASDFQSYFSSELHVHQSSAYITLNEDCSLGKTFPFQNTMSDCILLIHNEIRRRVSSYQWKLLNYETIELEYDDFTRFCAKTLKKHIEKFPKNYQLEGSESLAHKVILMMKTYGFIEINHQQVKIYPIVAKITGNYEGGN